jgi:GT2 family glycosyltransferase
MFSSDGHALDVQVGIVVLNFHQPLETLACVRRLISEEPTTSRIIWVENDARVTGKKALEIITESGLPFRVIDLALPSLPHAGTLGVIFNDENLGYAEGNNVALRLLRQKSVPFAWILNNDTYLLEGNSEALVQAALARPEVGLWGTTILVEHHLPTSHTVAHLGGHLELKDFSVSLIEQPDQLEDDPQAYISGCSLFAATGVLETLDYIPQDYFLYYEDTALAFEARKLGFKISGVPKVKVHHVECLSTGRGSPLMEFYNRRNRWFFIQRYFPDLMARQKWRIWYRIQKWAFRAHFVRIWIEILAFLDFQQGRLGKTHRVLPRKL